MNSRKGFLVVVALLTVALCGDNQISRATVTNDGLVVERKAYAFPTYEQAVETTDVENTPLNRFTKKLLVIKIMNSRS